MEYEITTEGKALMARQKSHAREWKIKSHYFGIAFTSNPETLLDYGPNGLHYTEHVLYNIIKAKCAFFDGNASTFDDGTMTFYFIGHDNDLKSNINGFFDAFETVLDSTKWGDYKEIYTIEQRRVTSEVTGMGEWSGSMFTRNPEMYMGKFPAEYVYAILLKECKLEKVLLINHGTKGEADAMFMPRAKAFLEKWHKRTPPSPTVPFVPIFSPSHISTSGDINTIKKALGQPVFSPLQLDTIDNPIVRMIVVVTLFYAKAAYNTNPYYMRLQINKDKKLPKKLSLKMWDIKARPGDDQYYWSDYLLSTGDDVKQEHVDDMLSLSSEDMLKKYGQKAKKILASLSSALT